jgi:hypothetical protein
MTITVCNRRRVDEISIEEFLDRNLSHGKQPTSSPTPGLLDDSKGFARWEAVQEKQRRLRASLEVSRVSQHTWTLSTVAGQLGNLVHRVSVDGRVAVEFPVAAQDGDKR